MYLSIKYVKQIILSNLFICVNEQKEMYRDQQYEFKRLRTPCLCMLEPRDIWSEYIYKRLAGTWKIRDTSCLNSTGLRTQP